MSKKQKGVFEGKLCRVFLGNFGEQYELARKNARFCYGAGYSGNRYVKSFCVRDFESLTGIKLEVNEEVMVKITIETTPIKKVKK